MLGRSCLFALCLATFLGARTAAAHPNGPNAPYLVHVQDEAGRDLPTFQHDGQTFVLGRFGTRYDIRVENRTARRIEAVVTVDGRDVISGDVGDFVHGRGYLIGAYGDVTIEGFRRSWDEVAAFRFTSPRASYSARMGTPENVGVIGVAVFPERERAVIARPQRAPVPTARGNAKHDRSAPASAPAAPRSQSGALGESARADAYEGAAASAAPAPSTDNLGTEYGEDLASAAQEVAFERADPAHPAAVIALRYDDRAGLLARGIALEPAHRRPACGPQAFPYSRRFAPPPSSCRD